MAKNKSENDIMFENYVDSRRQLLQEGVGEDLVMGGANVAGDVAHKAGKLAGKMGLSKPDKSGPGTSKTGTPPPKLTATSIPPEISKVVAQPEALASAISAYKQKNGLKKTAQLIFSLAKAGNRKHVSAAVAVVKGGSAGDSGGLQETRKKRMTARK